MKTSKLSLSELSVKSFTIKNQASSLIRAGEQLQDNDPEVTMIDRQSCANCTNFSG